MVPSKLFAVVAGISMFVCFLFGSLDPTSCRADPPDPFYRAWWDSLSNPAREAEIARLAKMQAAERLRWIALEGDAGNNNSGIGSAAAHAHGKCASAKEHVALCCKLRFEERVWGGRSRGVSQNTIL